MQKIKNIIVVLLLAIILFSNTSYAIDAITVPEIDINLTIENITRGSKTYVLLPIELLRYNMEKFISNNKNNPYLMEAEEADDLQEFLNKQDFVRIC